ncbi:MAG: ATP-binding protein [Candidatus Wallbacteria bacterium]|nr:ATP-binding protein [Candidatus Wallbacteria bacterium]
MYKRSITLPTGENSFFLFGPRQTGKSTLISGLLSDRPHLVLNFLERDTFLRYKTRPEHLRKEIQAMDSLPDNLTVFIDEVQKVPEILDEVHLLIETYKEKLAFVMTGSSARKIRRSGVNLLAGRAWQYHLYPLTHQELGKDFVLNRALCRGSLPPVIKSSDSDAAKTLEAYTQTYLKEEVLDEALTRNVSAFSRFLEIAADQNGMTVNYSNIARETQVSVKTIQAYYQILEDTLIVYRLPPYIRSTRRRLVQHPKYYFFDTGVVQSLLGRAAQPVKEGTSEFGRLFEHFIIIETMRLAAYSGKNWRFYHWRSASGSEVDLVIETGEGVWAVEVKTGGRIEAVDLQGLRAFQTDHPGARAVCAGLNDRPYRAGDFNVIPWKDLFSARNLDLQPGT